MIIICHSERQSLFAIKSLVVSWDGSEHNCTKTSVNILYPRSREWNAFQYLPPFYNRTWPQAIAEQIDCGIFSGLPLGTRSHSQLSSWASYHQQPLTKVNASSTLTAWLSSKFYAVPLLTGHHLWAIIHVEFYLAEMKMLILLTVEDHSQTLNIHLRFTFCIRGYISNIRLMCRTTKS